MEQRTLGRTGVQVSTLCLGAMSFGSYGNPDHDDCIRIIHRALDAGITFIDTADVYSSGESEQIVAKALKGRRDEVVLATKFFYATDEDPNHRGGSRRWIMQAVEGSLRRLGTDYLDLYQMHRPDRRTDIDETLGALSDLVRQGKVRMIGSSTFPGAEIVEAQWVAEKRGHIPFRCEQPPYSIFTREIEREVLPACQTYGMGAIVWSPLNSGWLTGKYRAGQPAPVGTRLQRQQPGTSSFDSPGAQRKLALVAELEKVAADAGLDLITMAIAFTLEHPAVTASIIGPRTMQQLDSQLAAGETVLDADTLDRIDALVKPGSMVSQGDVAHQPASIRRPDLRRRRRA